MDSKLKLRKKGPKKVQCGSVFFVALFVTLAVLFVLLNLSIAGHNTAQSTQLSREIGQDRVRVPTSSTSKRIKAESQPSLKIPEQEKPAQIITQQQNQQAPSHKQEASSTTKPDQIHVVFSTSCSVKQDWQSYLFFFNAMVHKQQGTVTRIVSGCTPEQEAEMSQIFQEKIAIMNEHFHLHFTPEFGRIQGKSFQVTKYWNKPFGTTHWLENKFGYRYEGNISTSYDDDIIILVDPDMLMQRPFVNDFSNFPNNIWQSHFENQPDQLHHKVSQGHPMAQDYSFRSGWLLGAGKDNLTYIVGPDSPVHNVSRQDATNFFSAGPPYMLTARDMYRVVYHWTDFLPRLFDVKSVFMVEMYGYCMAAAHLGLKHQIARGFMVSNVDMSRGEGWAFLNGVKGNDVCRLSELSETVPHVIHFCQRYSIGEFFLSKYKLPVQFLSCDFPLMELPPLDIAATANFSHYGNGDIKVWNETGKHLQIKNRHAFMVCSILSALNQAATFFKDHHCPNGANYNQTWNTFRIEEAGKSTESKRRIK